MRIRTLIFACIATFTLQPAGAVQTAPSTTMKIAEINGQKVTSGENSLARSSSYVFRGTFKSLGNATLHPASVFIVTRPLTGQSDEWDVSVTGEVQIGQSVGSTWSVDGMRLNGAEYHGGFQAKAVLVESSNGFTGTPIDTRTLLNKKLALSESVVVHLTQATPLWVSGGHTGSTKDHVVNKERVPGIKGPCLVGIRSIENCYGQYEIVDQSGDQDHPFQLGPTARLKGEEDRPNDVYETVIVMPEHVNEIWIMPRKGTSAGRTWTDTVYLGRGFTMDVGERFRIQACLSKKPIKEGHYSQDQWRKMDRDLICARSKEVWATKIVQESDLKITHVNNIWINKATIEAPLDCQIFGEVEDPKLGNPIQTDEVVYLLIHLKGADEGWQVLAMAIISGNRFLWRTPPVRFPAPGKYDMQAISSNARFKTGEVISSDAWFEHAKKQEIRRQSLPIEVTVDADGSDNSP